MRTLPCFLLTMFIATSATAQPVYETHDRDGPVFSDLPGAGRDLPSPEAAEVTLPPLNLSDSPPTTPAPAVPVVAAPYYQALAISAPTSGSTIHSNTGRIPLRIAIQPALRADQGDAILVELDGTALPSTRTLVKFDISAAEWQMAAKDDVEHRLQVSVLDHAGKVLRTSAAVNFYVHRATQTHRAR